MFNQSIIPLKYEYTLQEQDYLDFQLFIASKSERISNKRRNGWIWLTIGSSILAAIFYLIEKLPMTIYFGLAAVLILLFFPRYFKWRYKSHYKKHIREHYKKKFNEFITIEIYPDFILTKDKIGESKIISDQIEIVHETLKNFFVKVSTGDSFIIAKDGDRSSQLLRDKFNEMGIPLSNEQDWKW